MRKLVIALVLVAATAAMATMLSPWPGVYVIRAIFDSGAAAAAAKLEKHVPAPVTTETMRYDAADADAVLDIYRAPGTSADAPTIVWVHGGGFVSGRRGDIANYLKVLAGQGFAVVNVDYTTAPEATYPTPVRQVMRALDFVVGDGGGLGLGAFALLSATYNPTSWNFVRWARSNWTDQMPLAVFLGLLLAVAYMVYVVATIRSIGAFGVVLIAAIFGAGLWVLIDWGVLTLAHPSLNLWLGILVLSLILGIGLSWSILRQRLSGQASVDEIEG